MVTFLSKDFLAYALLAYLSGSVCFGYLIAKLKKIDLSQIGSRSATSSNVARGAGLRWGVANAILDFAKSFFIVYGAQIFFSDPWQIIVLAILPTIGHIFPIWFHFKGGKGGATFNGAVLAILGLKFYLFIFLFFILIVLLTKKTSTANFVFPVLYLGCVWQLKMPLPYFVFGFAQWVLISYGLRDNLRRLAKGEELTIPLK